MPRQITLRRPDDMHLHLRDGALLRAVLPFSARQMARAVIMPNLKPAITTTKQALAYRQRIIDALPANADFQPLMTLYLTRQTTPEEVMVAKQAGICAIKHYPAGATTNSDAGVADLLSMMPVLKTMAQVQLPLLLHGEVVDANTDIFDREALFIDRILKPLMDKLPELKIVFEHVTTAEAVDVIRQHPALAATVTPQHLLMNRNAILVGGVRPHHYCLPVLKRESHRQALLEAVTGPFHQRFFLGTDSAPHEKHTKETACGCAGIFSAHAALELYAEAFDSIGKIDYLPTFASENGAAFYGLPLNEATLTLEQVPQAIPTAFSYIEGSIVPLRAGEQVAWQIKKT